MMEHEQINDKCVALSMRGTKITSRMLAQMMKAFIRFGGKAGSKLLTKHGEQSLKSLSKKGGTLDDIEISGDNIGTFRKVAREYNIDFSLKKDSSLDPPRWTVFFRAKDDKSMQSAFNKYAQVTLNQQTRKASMLDKLEKFKEFAKAVPEKIIERIKDKTQNAFR